MYILHNEWSYDAPEISPHVVLHEYPSVRKLSGDIVASILRGSQAGSASLGALNGRRGGPFHVPSQPPFSSELNTVFRGITLLFREKPPEYQAPLWHPGLV